LQKQNELNSVQGRHTIVFHDMMYLSHYWKTLQWCFALQWKLLATSLFWH